MTKCQNPIYFHGLPGSPSELQLFGLGQKTDWFAPDRRLLNPQASLDEHFDALADTVRTQSAGGAASLVGFSLGAYVALEVAHRLPQLAITIDLVSAAAPLDLANCLDRMAGKTVFRLARDYPSGFAALTAAQSFAVRIAPGRLCNALFANARGEDRDLSDTPEFRLRMNAILRNCLAGDTRAYRREVTGYVSDWSQILAEIEHPVTLWHGLEDNWSPPEMAERLSQTLPNVSGLHLLPGLSHYSTLRAFQQRVLDEP
jgi:pimeloyl-ACP methyl ester carboxylesterase